MGGFLDSLLTQAGEALVPAVLLWLPLLELAAVCVVALNELEPRRRRGLFPLFVVLLALAAVLFGGAAALGHYGLVWRTWFQEGLSVILWLVGLATGILTVAYGRRWMARRWQPKRAELGMTVTLFCLVSAMFVGTVLGGLWCLGGPGEQVVAYKGQKMILGTWTWMERTCSLYEYHGPLVRGDVPVPDWDESLVEGAVNVPWCAPW